MDVYDRSAWETLVLPSHDDVPPPWAVFDPGWYRAAWPDAPDLPDTELLEWHLQEGQTRAYSPNRYFAEAWQRRSWPGIQDLIATGTFRSAFDAWCRGAHAFRQPHWLFDPSEYRHRFPGLTAEALEGAGLLNLYDHYLRFGAPEGRIGHPLFDPAVYLAHFDPADAALAAAMPFDHYLQRLERREPELRPSHLFNPDWYGERYPAAARAVGDGNYGFLLEHYLCNDTPAAFDPSPWFSEAHYLTANPGLAASFGPGGFRNGFAHFLAHGLREGRSPTPGLDLRWYASRADVQADIAAERAPDAYVHWIVIGHPAGQSGLPPPDVRVLEPEAVVLHQRRAATIWSTFGRRALDFTHDGNPALTAIVAMGGDIAQSLVSLSSLRACYLGGIDLILIDSDRAGSGEDFESHVRGATVLRFGIALNAAAVREAGVVCAVADTLLFLAAGMELSSGSIEAAVARLVSDPSIGAVGGRLVRPHGTLLEAGGIVWRDGRLLPYCQDESPQAPEANFVRDTDFCSTRFMLARKAVLEGLAEQASGIAGSSHDAADVCVRIQRAGFRVVYEPDAVAFLTVDPHDPAPDGQAAFAAAHGPWLSGRPDAAPDAISAARAPYRGEKRVLFIEDSVPLRRIGSGFVRSNDVVHALAASGAAVTIFPMKDNGFPLAAIRAELPDTVEVMHDRTAADFADFCAARPNHYDTIWIARTHNLDLIRATVASLTGPDGQAPRVIVDTEAVDSVRRAEQAAVLDQPFDLDASLCEEFTNLPLAAAVVAVTEAEAAIIRAHHAGPVAVLGHGIAPRPTPRAFEERSGILFVGAVHGMTHPNYDGLVWFADEVLPLIEKALRWETRLTIAGYIGPEANLDRFKGHPRITLRGPVTDLTPLYDSHRVVVAPARFAAGIPYKVHEAAAHGVPVIATSLLARQLVGWNDAESLAATDWTDPEGYADRVIALHRDPALWAHVRWEALKRVAEQLDPGDFAARAVALLRTPVPPAGGTSAALFNFNPGDVAGFRQII